MRNIPPARRVIAAPLFVAAGLALLLSGCGGNVLTVEASSLDPYAHVVPRTGASDADGAFLRSHRTLVLRWLDSTTASLQHLSVVLTADPQDTLGLQESCHHSWRKQATDFDELRNLVAKDPSQLAAEVDVALRLASAAFSACEVGDAERATELLRRTDTAIDALRATFAA